MSHHVRSGIAIVFACVYLGISWRLEHHPADWEYVFLMFLAFSSAMQDAMDGLNNKLERLAEIVGGNRANTAFFEHDIQQAKEEVKRELRQEAEFLKCHVTREANNLKTELELFKYELALERALEKGEDAPETPQFISSPEPKFVSPEFVPPELPKIEPFDARNWRTERAQGIVQALRGPSWWDMTLVIRPLVRAAAYINARPGFIRWVTHD
jgi:hypothetical protein